MKTKYFLLSLALATMFFAACGSKNSNDNYAESSIVDVNEQQKPRILVMPSDQLLERFNKLNPEDSQGKTVYNRDYAGYLLSDKDSKFIIASIQDAFIQYGYPLNDLEQTLKSINDQNMIDEVDGIKKDAKSILLTTAKPDIILELDYRLEADPTSRNLSKRLTYTLRAIDAFSNKVVATIQQAGFSKGNENNPSVLMKEALEKDTPKYTEQIDGYFANILTHGRDITVRITINGDVNLSMSDNCLDGDTYTDFIIDWMKANTLKGAYNMARNTDTELYFTDVRIKTLNDNGTQYSAYDFARELSKALNKGCGVKSVNHTQGLGDALISIKGM